MSPARRLFPSFDGPIRVSPYFYIPPKRRWWPTLAAFGAGGLCVLILFGPSQQADDPAAEQKPIAHQVRPGSSVGASKLRKPAIIRAHPGASDAASSAPALEPSVTLPNTQTAMASPPSAASPAYAVPEPLPTRVETAMASVQEGNRPSPAATQIETTPPTLAKPSARETAAKSSSAAAKRQAKKQRQREPATETFARDDRKRDDRDRVDPGATATTASAPPAVASAPEPPRANAQTAAAPAFAASPAEASLPGPPRSRADSALASAQEDSSPAVAATQIDPAPAISVKPSARQSTAKSSLAFEQRHAKKRRRGESAETFAGDERERDYPGWSWGDNREWGWDFRGDRDYQGRGFAERSFGNREQRTDREFQGRDLGDRSLRSRELPDRNLRGREFKGHNFRDSHESYARVQRSPGYRHYSDFSGQRFENQGPRWDSWGKGPSFSSRGGWFGGED